jgi:hypothetical protein
MVDCVPLILTVNFLDKSIVSIDQRFQTRFNLDDAGKSPNIGNGSEVDAHLKDPIRWTKLRKISSQLFSERSATRYGEPTCLLANAIIAVGTARGYIMTFDYHQNLMAIIGTGTKSLRCGPVTALALSYDGTHMAAGHANGNIFTWELSKCSNYLIHINPLPADKKVRVDGHIEGSQIIHLGFIGNRHSALVSGDVHGMAFAHNATFTLLGRLVQSHKLIGRYPQELQAAATPGDLKPTTLFAMENLSHRTGDTDIGLVAVITPNLLGLITLHPAPKTQFKTGRPKSVSMSTGLSGCLSWHKSTALRAAPLLAYCWSNVVTIVEVHAAQTYDLDVTLTPKNAKRFVGTESIVSVRWLSDKVLALVTVTQYLHLLNYETMSVSTVLDLYDKHIVHYDYFSEVLNHLKLLDPVSNEVVPVVLTDAYFNSISDYKGKLFMMGRYEFVVGSISNWSDKLLDTMESGDYKKAIELGVNYYQGVYDSAVVELPTNEAERKKLVMKNLPEMIIASVLYTFKVYDTTADKEEWTQNMVELTKVCLKAWNVVNKPDFILEQLFQLYKQYTQTEIFFDQISDVVSNLQTSPYISPSVFSELVQLFVLKPAYHKRLEHLICLLDINSLDLNLIFSLSKEHRLVDSLFYLWNHILDDFISPFVKFLELTQSIDTKDQVDALKIYPYISYILTGRVYPTGKSFDAEKAKSYVYFFIFHESLIAWPQQGGKVVRLAKPTDRDENGIDNNYPYLRKLMEFNSSAFFTALHEAFEDPLLNTVTTIGDTGDPAIAFGQSVTRQKIVDILLELEPLIEKNETRLFLDVFVARNYPKYIQFISVPEASLLKTLTRLAACKSTDERVRADCELGLIALLSVYTKRHEIPDKVLMDMTQNEYYEPLEYIYRSREDRLNLIRTKLLRLENTPNEAPMGSKELLELISHAYKHVSNNDETESDSNSDSSSKINEVREELTHLVDTHFRALAKLDGGTRLARIVSRYAPELHENVSALADDPALQRGYLASLMQCKELIPSKYISLYEKLN